MRFLKEYKKQVLILMAIALAIISTITAGRKINATFVDNMLGFIIVPFQSAANVVTGWISGVSQSITSKTDMADENALLKAEVDRLTAENKRLSLYEQDNEKLSALLDIAQKYPSYETVGTQIIGKDPGNWYDTFMIDKGKNDGIKTGMVLMDAGGLVGKITEVGNNYSKCQSILDNRSSVSAVSLRTGDLGVVRGDYEMMQEGLCMMEYIDSEAQIMEGDEIVTSHISDIYPSGISIGQVKEIRSDSNGLTKYAIIKPQVDLKRLDTLLIITASGQAEPVLSEGE